MLNNPQGSLQNQRGDPRHCRNLLRQQRNGGQVCSSRSDADPTITRMTAQRSNSPSNGQDERPRISTRRSVRKLADNRGHVCGPQVRQRTSLVVRRIVRLSGPRLLPNTALNPQGTDFDKPICSADEGPVDVVAIPHVATTWGLQKTPWPTGQMVTWKPSSHRSHSF